MAIDVSMNKLVFVHMYRFIKRIIAPHACARGKIISLYICLSLSSSSLSA